MRNLAGQAARTLWRLCHRALTVLLALAVFTSIALGALSWRLAQRPLDLSWLSHRIEAAANPTDGITITIQSTALAWEGWRLGLDNPLDIRLAGITVSDADGTVRARIPAARLSFSFAWLLLGRLVPRAIEIDGAQLRVIRATDGTIDINFDANTTASSPFTALLSQILLPERSDASIANGRDIMWTQLNRVRISQSSLVVIDHQLGATWQAPQAEIDLHRRPQGGIDGSADISLALGSQTTRINAAAELAPDSDTELRLRFSSLVPAALATAASALAPLAALDAPVDGDLSVLFGRDFMPRHITVHADIGSGTLLAAQSRLPLESATLDAAGNLRTIDLRSLRIKLPATGGPGSILQLHGSLSRGADISHASLAIDIDRLAFADLARYWPKGPDSGARAWVTGNITAGIVRDAHADLAFSFTDASDVALTAASGQLIGEDLTLNWLRPVPPVEHARATLTIQSPDALLIAFQGGREAGGSLMVPGGLMRISGLQDHDQLGAIDINVAGPLNDTIALLRQPRLGLLSRHPIELRDPAGQVALRLTVALPLRRDVGIDQVAIRAQGQLSAVHLAGVIAGRDIDQGNFGIDAGNDGLKLDGTLALAAIPASLGLQMDFRAGPPQQVLQRVTLAASPTGPQLAAIGVDTNGILTGMPDLRATLAERRDGTGQATLHADLLNAGLAVAPLAWKKPPGIAAQATVRLQLDHDRITSSDRIELQGDGVSVHGQAAFADGKPAALNLDQITLGATRAHADIKLRPTLQASIIGSSLDLSARLAEHRTTTDSKPGPPWVADARFDTVILGPDRTISSVTAHAENDGTVFRAASLTGSAGPGASFRILIAPDDQSGRRLTGQAADAGALLRALDIAGSVQGGNLTLSGRFDDSTADHPLSATADLSDFRLGSAPLAAKLLQAMTLYGLANVLSGPGIGFTQLIAPFRLSGDTLDLFDVRAFSPSLGFTAKGRIDLRQHQADLQGTIVPAYFFNTMLGNLPMVGRYFSPEAGGGVFAATFAAHGKLDDPDVTVNPLAALTPGFLRGLFGLFDK
jgi:hypothetical protein